MPNFETIRRVPFSASHMYDIVADVERYPEFLPLCDDLVIIEQQKAEACNIIIADMTVAYKAIKETFGSKVTLTHDKLQIKSESINGPFEYLLSNWRFEPVSEGICDVHYSIDYAFNNWMMQKLIGNLFEKAVSTYSASFEERAAELKLSVENVKSKS